jgi:hypothetical protein
MATPQLSPGVLIREVDLTVGRADNVLDNIGAIAAPFVQGPVDEAVDITTEKELVDVFGKPQSLDGQYEYWMSASSFLSYGGVMKVVRTDDDSLVNANARRIRSGEAIDTSATDAATTTVGIDTLRPPGTYVVRPTGISTYSVNSGDPVPYGAIFTITVADNGAGLGSTVTVAVTNGGTGFKETDVIGIGTTVVGLGTTGNTVAIGVGFTFGITDIYTTNGESVIGEEGLKIKNFDDYQLNYADDIAGYMFSAKNPGSWSNSLKVCVIDDKADQIISIGSTTFNTLIARADNGVGLGVTVSLENVTFTQPNGINTSFTGYIKGIVTGVRDDSVDVKIISRVAIGTDVDTHIQYKAQNRAFSIRPSSVRSGITTVNFVDDAVGIVTTETLPIGGSFVKDWYDEQKIDLVNADIFWRSIAPKPVTNQYVLDRNGKNDCIHIAVIDDTGEVTGIQGNLLEKFLNLSKAFDAVSSVNPGTRIWYKDYLAQFSQYIYAGDNPSDNENNEEVYQTGFSELFTPNTVAQGLWNESAQDKTFSAIGNAQYVLTGGRDYGDPDLNPGDTGTLTATLGNLFTSYDLFANRDEIQVDYLIMGPGLADKFESQAKAAHLISIANSRKDCVAVISPHRGDVVSEPEFGTRLRQYLTPDQITDNIIEFFSFLPSSSYAIFDTGYKYTYDRFNNKFRYIPCNPDVAGLCVRTSIFAYPWFSPAGQQRGILNNAIKLAYSPNKAQRDQLYPQRINAIVAQPGIGILLFGDKTALGYASAFDRINVRRLFLTIEQALEKSAQAQLFELNDQITRANFVNIVEPYLRDVQAKRGLYGFLVVCDETNNTPDVIDNNEFRADIFLKPAKSINYVTLTFVATRTGVSFEEVAGRV